MSSTPIPSIAQELGIQVNQVQAAIDLFESGNTIPFIARYRKESTGALNETQLRSIEDLFERAKTFESRKSSILRSIGEQGKLTDSLRDEINRCHDLATLELIYLPFKPKRRTRATQARDRGLEPLAKLLIAQQPLASSRSHTLGSFVNPELGVPDEDAALAGALDIVAESWSEQRSAREWLIEKARKFGKVASKVKRGKKQAPGADKYQQYFDRQEPAARIPGHRFLAMLRGAAEGILRVELVLPGDRESAELGRRWVTNRQFEFYQDLQRTAIDAYQRLLWPSVETVILQQVKERAEDSAIRVFGKNLRELLMAAPAGPRSTMGIDPGFRTGCKVAVVDATGKHLEHVTIYPTPPKNDTQAASDLLVKLIRDHQVELIAIGNGTASRETDKFVGQLIQQHRLDVTKVVVSESGASIYSASELAVKEFPDLDITVRGAISIARRLQDPLAELVKTDPKSIGVGQYQHDVNQSRLKKCLDRVVESCVNQVGVDLNMASAALLSHVAGIGPRLAERIVGYRDQHGAFTQRAQLLKVPKLGKKAFQQAAGFLRIRGGEHLLDNSAVHPECYPLVRNMAGRLGTDLNALIGSPGLTGKLRAKDFVCEQFGLPTVEDIIDELAKPGRDPRQEFRAVKFDDQVNSIEDLQPNMVLEGVITNVTHFGAFIDLGVHQDALIHVSQLSHEFVSDPSEVVTVGDICKVKVIEIDVDRKRISVTRKLN